MISIVIFCEGEAFKTDLFAHVPDQDKLERAVIAAVGDFIARVELLPHRAQLQTLMGDRVIVREIDVAEVVADWLTGKRRRLFCQWAEYLGSN